MLREGVGVMDDKVVCFGVDSCFEVDAFTMPEATNAVLLWVGVRDALKNLSLCATEI